MDRRLFIKGMVTAGIAAIAMDRRGAGLQAATTVSFPPGIVYTKEQPGKWAKKVASHAPVVTVRGRRLTIETRHPMTVKHYIVRHTLVTPQGDVLGEKTFYPTDPRAMSEFEVPEGASLVYATSFCNKHDLWVTTVSL